MKPGNHARLQRALDELWATQGVKPAAERTFVTYELLPGARIAGSARKDRKGSIDAGKDPLIVFDAGSRLLTITGPSINMRLRDVMRFSTAAQAL